MGLVERLFPRPGYVLCQKDNIGYSACNFKMIRPVVRILQLLILSFQFLYAARWWLFYKPNHVDLCITVINFVR
jgi:hypothetical protein